MSGPRRWPARWSRSAGSAAPGWAVPWDPAWVCSRKLGEDGFSGGGPLPDADQHVGPLRQIGVQARAVPDQPVGVAHRDLVADLHVADDAPGHQTGNLHGDDLDALRTADDDAVALVVGTGRRQV